MSLSRVTPEASKPLVAKVVYGALGKITNKNSDSARQD